MRFNLLIVAATLAWQPLFPTESRGQSETQPLAPGYYIVVAAYRLGQDAYAQSYVNRISKADLKASYGADLDRKYLYVYLDFFTDYDQSIREMLATRKKEGFEQAWVRIMKGVPESLVKEVAKKEEIRADNSLKVEEEAKVDPVTVAQSSSVEEKKPVEEIKTEQVEVVVEASTPEEKIMDPQVMSDASVYLSLFNARNNDPIEGEVEIVDTERARLITKLKGNEYIKLPDPKSKSGRLTLIANVFGYRPIQHELNYLQTPTDTMLHYVEWAGNHYLVKFDLVRYHKGDIQTLYNVYFYNDAAIMLPESKYQLNNLLEMMKENASYKIMLHGHTNGNARGKLIKMGPSKSFFALADDVKEGTGSAKDLSKARAEVIKEWLLAQGVGEDRVEVKAWGGGRMLHDKNSVNAKKNIRVDVEILEE